MIVCKQCGHHNEDSDTFCGSCGKFLEWTGERVVVAQPEPEPEPEPAPQSAPEPARGQWTGYAVGTRPAFTAAQGASGGLAKGLPETSGLIHG